MTVETSISNAQDDWGLVVNEMTDYERKTAEIVGDPRFSDTHRRDQLAAMENDHVARLNALRTSACESLDWAGEQIEAEYQTARRGGQPASVGDWQEANARSQFVQADVEGMSPSDVLAAYKWALRKDPVGAFLIARHGIAHLEALADTTGQAPEAVPNVAIQARLALDELLALVDNGATQKRRDALNRLATLRQRFDQPLTPAEKRGFAERMGLDPRYIVHSL